MNTEVKDGVLYLGGDVTVKTVASAAYAQFEQQCRLKEVHTLDLSGVNRADSSCVSLLLTALRLNASGVKLCAIPESVQDLTVLYEIKDWVNT
ncbi:MAG: STAS domain-containing protein [Neisseria animaloris]|nr:STAS domain-containing protein [Neisseria animaloris]